MIRESRPCFHMMQPTRPNLGLVSFIKDLWTKRPEKYPGLFRYHKAFLFDANGIIYYRKENRMLRLERFLKEHELYRPLDEVEKEKIELAKIRADSDSTASYWVWFSYYLFLMTFGTDTYGIQHPQYRQLAMEALMEAESNIGVYPGVGDTLLKLQEKYKLGLVTNSISSSVDKQEWFNQNGLHGVRIDGWANSCELGVMKPEPSIYEYCCKEIGVSLKYSIFVAHDQKEIDGAKKLNLVTVGVNDKSLNADYHIDALPELLILAGLVNAPLPKSHMDKMEKE